MPWEKGILDGLSHMLDILPPDNLDHRMKMEDSGIGIPVRHWIYRIRGRYTNGLLLFVKDFLVQSNLYIVEEWTGSDSFRASVLRFHNPEELRSKLKELNVQLPPNYDRLYRGMQACIGDSDFRCFVKSAFDSRFGYREFVPVDEIGNVRYTA